MSTTRDTRITRAQDDPQYEIKSDKTDHIAMHKGQALTKNERLNVCSDHSERC